MYIVNKTKIEKKYKFPSMSYLNHRKTQVAWINYQKMKATLINIKSIDIQIKDIRKMIYTSNPLLINLYNKINFISSANETDFIEIKKNSSFNEALIFQILEVDWLLNLADLQNKTPELLTEEIEFLESCLLEHTSNITPTTPYHQTYHLRLLEYKLLCLKEYLNFTLSSSPTPLIRKIAKF